MPRQANLDKLTATSRVTADTPAPYKNGFHQDEKHYVVNARRRQRKLKKSVKEGSTKSNCALNRRHGTQVMFTGVCVVGPDGQPVGPTS